MFYLLAGVLAVDVEAAATSSKRLESRTFVLPAQPLGMLWFYPSVYDRSCSSVRRVSLPCWPGQHRDVSPLVPAHTHPRTCTFTFSPAHSPLRRAGASTYFISAPGIMSPLYMIRAKECMFEPPPLRSNYTVMVVHIEYIVVVLALTLDLFDIPCGSSPKPLMVWSQRQMY